MGSQDPVVRRRLLVHVVDSSSRNPAATTPQFICRLAVKNSYQNHACRRLLVHVVDGSSPDPCGDYAAIQQELALFSPGLAAKRQLVAYSKIDLPDSADYEDIVRDYLITQVGHTK